VAPMATGRSIMRVLCKVIQSQHPEYWALYRPTTHNKSLPTIHGSDLLALVAELSADDEPRLAVDGALLSRE